MNGIDDNEIVVEPWALDRATDAWNKLRIQLSSFNRIIAIESGWYGTWSQAEKDKVRTFMT